MRSLLLFANAFPFGTWEPYLETEVRHYEPFDRVEIFSLSVRPDQKSHQRSITDPRVRVHPLRFRSKLFYAVQAVRVIVDRTFYAELAALARQRRLTAKRFVQLVVFLSRAHHEAGEIARVIRKEGLLADVDEVVYYAYRFAYQPYLAELVQRKVGKRGPVVARAHGGDLYEDAAQNAYIPLRSRVARNLDAIYMVSEHGRDYVRALPGARERAVVSYLGTVDRGLAPVPELGGELKILTCSSLVRVKRLDRLIEGLAATDAEQPIRWVHYGEGPLHSELMRHAERQLPGHVTLEMRGPIQNTDLLDVYQQEPFHALINVSESEGLPVSMMEAGSFGIPIIATDVGGVREIIEDGVNGRLLSASPTPQEIAGAIGDVARADAETISHLRSGARRVWDEKFRADANYDRFVEGLISLTKSSRVQ